MRKGYGVARLLASKLFPLKLFDAATMPRLGSEAPSIDEPLYDSLMTPEHLAEVPTETLLASDHR